MHAKGGGKLLCMHVTVAVVFFLPCGSLLPFTPPFSFFYAMLPIMIEAPQVLSLSLILPVFRRAMQQQRRVCTVQLSNSGRRENHYAVFVSEAPGSDSVTTALFCSHACQSQWKEGGKQKSLLVRLSRNKAPNLPRRKRRRKSYRYKLWWKRGKIFFRRFFGKPGSERVGG